MGGSIMAVVINGTTGIDTIQDGTVSTTKIVADAVTTPKIADTVNLGRRNKIINGAFQVWQRGTSFTTSSVSFAADRFAHYQVSPSSNNVTQSTDVPDGFTYSCSINDAADMRCTVELPGQGIAGEFYNGSTWTLSFYARSTGSDLSYTTNMRFVNGPSYASAGTAWTSSNNSFNITSTWQRFEIQFTVNAAPTNSHYAVGFVVGGTSGRSIRFTGIQLEAGDTATPFEHRSYGEELTLCHRYYQDYTSNTGSGIYLNGTNEPSPEVLNSRFLPVVMRSNPTVVSPTSTSGSVGGVGVDTRTLRYFTANGHTSGGFSVSFALNSEL
jgi:hypothetical protein